MIYGSHQKATLLYPLTMLLGNAVIGIDKTLRRNSAKANYHLRLDEAYLLAKIVHASVLLVGLRVSVFRRTALEYVGYVNALARNVHRKQKLIKKLTGSAHKGSTRKILFFSWCFTDEKNSEINTYTIKNAGWF